MTTNSDHEPEHISTLQSALTFLKDHPKMPSDLEMDDEDFDNYQKVFTVLIKNPSPSCIPLFFNSLNKFSNEHLVQSFSNVLKAHDVETVIGEIINCLENGPEEAKAWVGEYIYDFPDRRFIHSLSKLLQHNDSSGETGLMTINVLRSLYDHFNDEQIKTILEQDYCNTTKWTQLRDMEERSNEAQKQFELNYRIKAADLAFMNKDYSNVVKELEEFEDILPELVKKKYLYSKKKADQKLK